MSPKQPPHRLLTLSELGRFTKRSHDNGRERDVGTTGEKERGGIGSGFDQNMCA